MKHILLFLLLLSAVFVSCKKQTKEETFSGSVVNLIDSTDFYTIKMTFPEDPADINDSVKTFAERLLNEKKSEWKTGGELYEAEQQLNKDFPDRTKYKYALEMDYDSLSSKKYDSRSYVFNIYEYTGGANGNSVVKTYSFTDKEILISDLLNLNLEKAISLSKVLAETALKDTLVFDKDFVFSGLTLDKLKADGSSLDLEKVEKNPNPFLANFENFSITDEGLNFYYDKYQIAPGAAGVTKISLSWEQLKPFLKK